MKNKNLVIISVLLMLFCTSCENFHLYYGEYFPYAVEARSSLLGVFGSLSDDILILETDKYGRCLYVYRGYSRMYDQNVIAILVSQRTDSDAIYYYDGKNFIFILEPYSATYPLTEQFVRDHFSIDEIKLIKTTNYWNEPMEERKLFETKISRKKIDTVSIPKLREAYGKFYKDMNVSTILLSQDKNGLSLYYVLGYNYKPDTKSYVYGPEYIMMFDKNGNLIPITGTLLFHSSDFDYQSILVRFKTINGWAFY
jgi:hypothetical protein